MKVKWNEKYKNCETREISPCHVLNENVHLLPRHGIALDYAAGLGGNALLLAKNKLITHAWDISSVALEKLQQAAKDVHLSINAEVRDVELNPPHVEKFDVIVASYFLHRPTFNCLIEALQPAGLLFYQTFTREKVFEQGPLNPDFLLMKNELLKLCSSLEILFYREDGVQGDVTKGFRNQAMIIARKPL